jgi:hypothetical protein
MRAAIPPASNLHRLCQLHEPLESSEAPVDRILGDVGHVKASSKGRIIVSIDEVEECQDVLLGVVCVSMDVAVRRGSRMLAQGDLARDSRGVAFYQQAS